MSLSASGMGHSSALSYREIVHIIICLSRANDYVAQSVRNGKSITEQRDIHLVVIVLSGHDMEMKLYFWTLITMTFECKKVSKN